MQDETGATGLIIFFCVENDWDLQSTVYIEEGKEGDWTDIVKCEKGEFIKTVSIKNEEKKIGDNSGINGFKFQCGNENNLTKEIKFDGPHGKYKEQTSFLPKVIFFLKVNGLNLKHFPMDSFYAASN